MRFLLFIFLLLPWGGCSRHGETTAPRPPAPAPPPVEEAIAQPDDPYYEEAKRRILALRPWAEIWKPEVEFIEVPAQMTNAVTGDPGFYAKGICGENFSATFAVKGCTSLAQFTSPLKSYIVKELPATRIHEWVHILWSKLWPTERCPNNIGFVADCVEHGNLEPKRCGECDPWTH